MTEHFHFRVGDRVRIVCQGLDVEGKVHSSYNDFDNLLAGVEMFEHEDTGYHYWKRGDGGKVYRWDIEYAQWLEVWPEFEEPQPDHVYPHFKVFLTDETDMWTSDVVSRLPEGCKLFGAYLVDVSREVHVCSLTPSYEAWWLYTVISVGNRDVPEDILDIISECDIDQEPVRYFSTKVTWAHDYGKRDDGFWNIDNSPHEWISEDFESYDDLIEHMLEEAHANHPV